MVEEALAELITLLPPVEDCPAKSNNAVFTNSVFVGHFATCCGCQGIPHPVVNIVSVELHAAISLES